MEENLNPVGRLFYSASTMICTPASLSQEVGLALGAQAGEARLREVLGQAEIPILADDNPKSLESRVLEAEHELYPKVLSEFARR